MWIHCNLFRKIFEKLNCNCVDLRGKCINDIRQNFVQDTERFADDVNKTVFPPLIVKIIFFISLLHFSIIQSC